MPALFKSSICMPTVKVSLQAADQPEAPADEEAADNQQAVEGQADDADMEEAQPQIRMSADVGKVNAAAAAPTQEEAPDEPVSDTDEDVAGETN